MNEDDDNLTPEERGRTVAAEYVLGVLDASARRAAIERLAHDSAFADEVAFWEERLAPLAASVTPVAPPIDAWPRIQHALDGKNPAARSQERLAQSLAFWRPFAIGSAALAVASIAALTFVLIAPPQRGPMMATLSQNGGQPGFVAAIGAGGRSLFVVPASLLTGDQRAYELWLIPPGDKPHSLGLIKPGEPVRLDVPADLAARVTTDAVLAVSVEPPGGSPTGQPTGPVIANGKLTSL